MHLKNKNIFNYKSTKNDSLNRAYNGDEEKLHSKSRYDPDISLIGTVEIRKMETGLLESLRKYRPREGKDPLENFITEAFAWILRNHSDFSDYFLNEIIVKLNMQLHDIDGKNCEWMTQYNFDGFFPDMVCLSNNNVIVFEHKAWSQLHDKQLQNYKRYASANFVNSKVVLITATHYQHSQDPDLALCWSDIYEYISVWLETNTDTPFIFEDFLRLLRSEGMGPPAPISHESIMYYYASTDLKKNIGGLIKRIENKDWSENIKQDYTKFVENKSRLSYGEAWGRMGVNLLDSWKPGIFVGILLNGNDHCTKPTNASKGPDFCLILDIDSSLHNQYPTNDNYTKLIDNLSKKVAKLNDGWQFYNHLGDSKIKTKNKWHPIHIRKPMLDVFLGSISIEKQAEVFYETANKLIKLVSSEDHFWELRNEYKKNL